MARKAAKSWDKSCRKAAKKAKRPAPEKREKKKRVSAGRFKVRRPQLPKGKSKEAPAAREEDTQAHSPDNTAAAAATTTPDSPSRAARVKARAAAVRDKTRRKGSAKPKESSAEAQEENEKKKRSKTAGKAALVCAPIAAVAQRGKRSKKRDETHDGEEQAVAATQPDGPSRTPMRQRFSERSGSVKRGLSTRGDALKQRIDTRRAKKTTTAGSENPGVEGPTPALMSQTNDVEPQPAVAGERTGVEADTTAAPGAADAAGTSSKAEETTQPKKSKAGKLLAIPAGLAAAIGAALKKRRQGKKTTSAEEDSHAATTGEKKKSKFSALQERLKALRTRVTMKRSGSGKKSSGKTSPVKNLNQKLKDKKAKRQEAKARKQADAAAAPTEPGAVKEHGAVMGLVGGFLALPAAKVREVRDKRRQSKPVAEGAAGHEAATSSAPLQSSQVHDRVSQDRPRYEPPIAEAEEESTAHEVEPSSLDATTQYLPGHGQSEIPVAVAAEAERPQPETRMASSETAVDQTAVAAEADASQTHQPPVTAAQRFKAMKNNIGNLKPKKRTAEETPDRSAVKAPAPHKPEDDTASSGGRLQNLKDGFGNLRMKRRSDAGATHPDGPATAEKNKEAATPDGSVPKEGRFKSIKDSLGNNREKKTDTEKPSKDKVYKDSTKPGFMDRMRWIWLMS